MLVLVGAGTLAACNRSGPAPLSPANGTGARFEVVAAEDFWGSLAAQLAGDRARVRSVIVDPGVDPHSYAATAQDARAVADSSVAIVNGLGYDSWASQLLAASPFQGRVVLDVGDLLGLGAGANPHRWYFPSDVERVAGAISADYARVDPADAGYFARERALLLTRGLARYDALRAEIRRRFAGVPVGYSESVFQGLGEDLGLRLLTPESFARAIAEGTDVTAADKRRVDAQASGHLIEVWVFNSQNVTPDVQRVNRLVAAAGIPVATITETLSPKGESFQRWQVSELEGLLAALHRATGR